MNAVNKAKISYIVYSVLLTLCGTLLIIFPEKFKRLTAYILGAVIIVCGIIKIIDYFINDTYGLAFQFDFAMGIVTILIGAILILHPGKVMDFINIVIGIFVMLDGAFKLQTAKDARQFGMKYWNVIFIFAVIACVTGILLIFIPALIANALISLTGIALVAVGTENLVVALYTVKLIKRSGPINKI